MGAGILLAAAGLLLAAGVGAVGAKPPGGWLEEERGAGRALGRGRVREHQVVEQGDDPGNLGGLPDIEAVPQGVDEGQAGGGDLALCGGVHADDATAE